MPEKLLIKAKPVNVVESCLKEQEYVLEKEYATLKAEMFGVEEDRLSAELEYRAMTTHLQKLKSLNPLAAAFHISRKDNIGVINGLRLGWKEKEEVPWEELSAAWGQTALLTVSLAKKLNIDKFDKYQLVPLGTEFDTKKAIKNVIIS